MLAVIYCACSRCGWGSFRLFLSPLSVLFFIILSLSLSLSLSLWEAARYKFKYSIKEPLHHQKKNQPTQTCVSAVSWVNSFQERCRILSICKYISAASWATEEACLLVLTVWQHRVLWLPILSIQSQRILVDCARVFTSHKLSFPLTRLSVGCFRLIASFR